ASPNVSCAGLLRPRFGSSRRRLAADKARQVTRAGAIERRDEVRLDLADETEAAIDQAGIDLHQRGARLDLVERCRAGIDAANADQRERAIDAHKSLSQDAGREREQRAA